MSFSNTPRLEVDTSNNQKYETKNPVVQHLIQRFLNRVHDHAATFAPERVADLGCGEGRVLERLCAIPSVQEVVGIEINPVAASAAEARLPPGSVQVGDITAVPPPSPQWADVTLCLEVLEHLEDPPSALRNIAQWTRRAAILSVPWEPYFRGGSLLRGKYLKNFGNHPEHIQQFTPKSFHRLLKTVFPLVEIDRCFPWIIAVCGAPTHTSRIN